MLATNRRRVNLNSKRNDGAPGARLQDIREAETCVQWKKCSGSVVCIAVPNGRDVGIMSLKMEYFRSSGFECVSNAVLVSVHCY